MFIKMICKVIGVRSLRRRNYLFYGLIMVSIVYLFTVFQSRYSLFSSAILNFPFLDSSQLFFHRQFNRNKSTFFPGSFLNYVKPTNKSYCSFRLGFPDYFDLSDSEVNFSPELGEKGSYRVIYNVLQGSLAMNQSNQITYCSHLTPDFLFYLAEVVIRWEGPISVAAFVPSYDASTTLCLLQRLCSCIPEMSQVSLHFVFPLEYPPDHITCDPVLSVPAGCSVPIIVQNKRLNTFRNQEDLTYPVNVARNVARTSAYTKFVLVSDIELIPSISLISRFQKMVPKLHLKIKSDIKTKFKHLVYVLPVFEVEYDTSKIPEKKSELLDLYSQNKAVYFHRWICLHCQRFPGLQRWIHHSSYTLDNTIQPMLVVRREFPYHRWEPIYIGTNEEPLYSEMLSWEGKQDKMIQMHEMCLMGYRFVILDGAFLVHAPGVKRRSSGNLDWLDSRTAHHFENMQRYDEIMRKVTKQRGSKQGCRIH